MNKSQAWVDLEVDTILRSRDIRGGERRVRIVSVAAGKAVVSNCETGRKTYVSLSAASFRREWEIVSP